MKCKNCGRQGAYIRLTTKDILCRQCGHVSKQDKKEVDNERNEE